MLRECSAYSSSRADFLLKLQEKLGNGFERFDALGKSSFISGSELWEEHFDLLRIMSTSGRRGKLNYMVMTHPSLSPRPGIWGNFTGNEGQSGKNMCQGGKPDTGKFHSSYIGMNVRMWLCL